MAQFIKQIRGVIMAESSDEFFTSKHKRLKRISGTANILAWIVLLFFVLQTFSQILIFTGQQSIQASIEMFKENPELALNLFLSNINILFQGVVYWLILKGVSLGLNMIVETNLNYRGRVQG